MEIYNGQEINKKAGEIKKLIDKAGKDKYSQEWLEVDIRNVLHKLVEEVKTNTVREILHIITTNNGQIRSDS